MKTYINATGLSVVNFTLDDCGISSCFYLKSGDSVVVNVVFLKVALLIEIFIE